MEGSGFQQVPAGTDVEQPLNEKPAAISETGMYSWRRTILACTCCGLCTLPIVLAAANRPQLSAHVWKKMAGCPASDSIVGATELEVPGAEGSCRTGQQFEDFAESLELYRSYEEEQDKGEASRLSECLRRRRGGAA
eukprot:TRINITY_DN15015_c0_g1_i11.p2 TRINITY_DN15015_c0_g1~~TRINITY_DN15015_c0_g1_i11.p2  ORF type:complete len:137 (-),score=20.01 TRINITY_DN15015_c0_g1_i11:316-726(-)